MFNITLTNESQKQEKISHFCAYNCCNSFNYVIASIILPFVVPVFYLLVDIGRFFDKILLCVSKKGKRLKKYGILSKTQRCSTEKKYWDFYRFNLEAISYTKQDLIIYFLMIPPKILEDRKQNGN